MTDEELTPIGRPQLLWPLREQAAAEVHSPAGARLAGWQVPDSSETATEPEVETGVGADANLLVEGDNLPALKLLQPALAGRVKVVYIDPPYNTGSSLSYADRARADAAVTSRDAWLAMMYPRLVHARALMRVDGVIFVSIDDRESAAVQLLCHEIFGEENFLGTFVHQRAKGGGNAKFFVRGHDYIHVWAKDAAQASGFTTEKRPPAKYERIDGQLMLIEDDVLRVSFGKYTRGTERRLMYEDIVAVRGQAKKDEVDAGIAAGRYQLRPWGEGKHAVARLTPAHLASSKMYSIIRALGETGRQDLIDLGLGGIFAYPKPVELLTTLIASQTMFDPEAIVLDFFAGSGTTAQAVIELNRRDGGSRRFVLIQQPEPIRAAGGARVGAHADAEAVAQFPTISAFMAERVRRAGGDFIALTVAADETDAAGEAVADCDMDAVSLRAAGEAQCAATAGQPRTSAPAQPWRRCGPGCLCRAWR
ncbi:site-specific DNA-methyltransferase [Brevibacterium luteolum]|uniref:site-specific DNA-methyltransferase n=1 Tax=Brevibacterium luteolum TaxID=199591 RepID=UPI003B672FA4